MIEPDHPQLSVAARCRLVSINRSGLYHKPAPEAAANLGLMRLIDKRFMAMNHIGLMPIGACTAPKMRQGSFPMPFAR